MNSKRVPFILVLAPVLALACEKVVPEPEPPPKPTKIEKPKEEPAAQASAAPTEKSDVVIEDLVVGKGAAAKKGDRLSVHYTGKLANGTKFDSSRDRDEPFDVTLGEGGVIRGWEEGLLGIKKGGKRKLTIPPEKGYGAKGSPPKIPGGSTLVFEIEALDING